MTKASDSPVKREVTTRKGEVLIVTVTAEGLYLREKRSRSSFLLPWGVAYTRAAILAADSDIENKKRRRRVSRGLLTTGSDV